ncbi:MULTISPECIES: reverse transcriptase family protein [unclassified Thiocapsa]|uniref:reverse transcriptase family protein n=1 Tax=unclassified Thiocapsa TaxID=2641286 RepID=UPI0035B4D668
MSRAKPVVSYAHTQSPFYRLASKRRLAELLGLDAAGLRRIAKYCQESGYNEWDNQSESGKTRRIESPKPELSRVQKRVATLLSRITPPDFLYCPVKGKSYVKNALIHETGAELICLDVKSYFASTPSRRVFWFFQRIMECSKDVAGILAVLSTYQGHLPTGSPTSPILSFYAHCDMWAAIASLALEYECRLSVYMDDITISGPRVPERLVWEVKQAVFRNGLLYHKAKRFQQGRAREVTGVILGPDGPKLPHRHYEKLGRLRGEIAICTSAQERELLERMIQGYQAQAKQVTTRPPRAAA